MQLFLMQESHAGDLQTHTGMSLNEIIRAIGFEYDTLYSEKRDVSSSLSNHLYYPIRKIIPTRQTGGDDEILSTYIFFR